MAGQNKFSRLTDSARVTKADRVRPKPGYLQKREPTVVATDIQHDKLEEVVKSIKEDGGEALAVDHDVTNKDEWKATVEKTREAYGRIDVLIKNAGIGGAEGYAPLDEIDLDSWNKFIKINSTGNFLGIKTVAPEMQKSGGGSIVNTFSIAGLVGGAAGLQYTASKGAAMELA